MPKIDIEPKILRWAMQWSKVDVDSLAKTLNIKPERIQAWMEGNDQPTFRQAKRLAEKLHIAFGYFFLPEPPTIETPIPDLRTLPDSGVGQLGPNSVAIIQDALRKQDWYREYRLGNDFESLKFIGSFDVSSDYIAVAKSMSAYMEISQLRKSARSWTEFFRFLVQQAETIGVLVLRSGVVGDNTTRTLPVDEFRGFAISDVIAPIIFINSRDTKAAQIFTFAHELSHLWLGQSGISDFGLTTNPKRSNNIESFCNSIAAEFLVPADDFRERWSSAESPVELANQLARTYKTSTLVIIRRAQELGYLDWETYIFSYEELLSQLKPKQKSKGGSYDNNFFARNGARFTDEILTAISQDNIGYTEASRLLNTNVNTLDRILKTAKRG